MATRTVSNAGGNWNATGTWVGGVVPVAGDDVNFTATSGNLTVNVSTANLIGITFANYVGTITFSNAINTSGFVNLGTGGYTQAGANGINLVGTTTLTSGGVTWSRTLTFTGASITYTLAGNWTSTGAITFSGTTATTVNGNTLNIGGNLTVSSTATISGTTIFNFNGTGTWSHSSTGVIRNNTTVNTAGTLTIGTNVYYNTGTLTYTAGTVVTTGSTLNIGASTTLNTNGITWNNITATANSVVVTLGSNLTLTGTLTTITNSTLSFTLGGNTLITTNANILINGGSTLTLPANISCINLNANASGGTAQLNGNQLSVTGNLTVTGNNNINQGLAGTTTIVLAGTGTWSSTSLGPVACNLTINTSGTITISGNVYYYGESIAPRTLTYTTGTVVTTGSTLFIGSGGNPTSTTLNTNGIVWNNITTFGTSGATTITSSSNLTVSNTLSLSSSNSAITLNSNSIFVGGNLTINTSGNIISGTSTIVLNGTGTWSSAGGTSTLRNNTTINTAGTITIGTNIYYNTGILTYTAGTVVTTGSTLNILSANVTLATNGITWNNITTAGTTITLSNNLTLTGIFTVSGGTTAFTLGGNTFVSANANLTIGTSGTFTMPVNQIFKTLSATGSGGSINGNTLTVTENLVINATLSGTTNIIYGGTGTWTSNAAGLSINNNFTINTAGTLTISGIVSKGSGTFTYTAGTVIDTGATVLIGTTANTTVNISGKTWEKLLVNFQTTLTSNINAITFGTHTVGGGNTSFVLGGNTINFTHLELGAGSTTTLPSNWTCQNLTITVNSGAILNGFSITVNGNILQSGNGSYAGTTTFTYAGTGTWTQTGTVYLSNSFTINTAGTLTFISANIGGGIFTYTAGTVITTGSTLYILVTGTTMNHGSIIWNNVTFGSPTGVFTSVASITLNNQLVCLGTLTFSVSNTTFGGTDGTFDTYNLVLGIDTTNRTTTLVSTKTYRVRQSLTCTQATNASRVLLRSTSAGSQAIFTLDPGATIDVGFVNATDINSSLGRPIYSYRGVFSNTLNWQLLPTDPVLGGAYTFVA